MFHVSVIAPDAIMVYGILFGGMHHIGCQIFDNIFTCSVKRKSTTYSLISSKGPHTGHLNNSYMVHLTTDRSPELQLSGALDHREVTRITAKWCT